jgi:hypothetical protein
MTIDVFGKGRAAPYVILLCTGPGLALFSERASFDYVMSSSAEKKDL